MSVLERIVFKVPPGKWAELERAEAVGDEIEGRWPFPPKRCYRPMFSGLSFDTFIIEREWESLASMEATQTEAWSHPDMDAFFQEYAPLYGDMVREVYEVLDWTPHA
jgi:hypothetical protein